MSVIMDEELYTLPSSDEKECHITVEKVKERVD